MMRVRRLGGKRSLLLGLIAGLCTLALPASSAFGEGSVDLNQGPDDHMRHALAMGAAGAIGLQNYTVLYVYAEAGETVQLASSAMGVGQGNILVYAPGTELDGLTFPADPAFGNSIFDCAADDPGTGLIASRAEELAGPQPNAGGYAACEFTPAASGIYPVIMMSPNPGSNQANSGTVGAPVQSGGFQIAMWDISVRDAAGAVQPGRTFADQFSLYTTGAFALDGSGVRVYPYTRTGYEYQVDFFNIHGGGWVLRADDSGIVDSATGERLFASFDCRLNPGDPSNVCTDLRAEFAPPESRHVMFLNRPDPLAIEALAAERGYATTPISPASDPLSDAGFTGSRGEQEATTHGQGGTFEFTSPEPMGGVDYTLVIDIDGNGTFGDDGDVEFTGDLAADGANEVAWDGLDADGATPPCGTYDYEIRTTLSEVHFPMLDVEYNRGGTRIERLSLPADPVLGDPLAASYNHIDPFKATQVTNTTPSAATDEISGPGFNSWDASSGDTDYTDVWTRLPEIVVTGQFEILCVDLEVAKSAPARVDRNGRITWAITVTNNGAGTSSGSTLTDSLPGRVSNPTTQTPGCAIANRTLECAIGELAPGESTQIVVRGNAPKKARTCVRNGASVEGQEDDQVAGNNSASVRTCTRGVPRLKLAKRAGKSVVRPGETVSYRIVVRNVGSGPAKRVRVCDRAHRDLEIVRAPGAKVNGQRACWTINSLGAKKRQAFKVVAQVRAGARPGAKPNRATAKGRNTKRARSKAKIQVRPPAGVCPSWNVSASC